MEDSVGCRLDVVLRHLSPSPPAAAAAESFNRCSNSSVGGVPVVIGSMVLDIHACPSSNNELRTGTTAPGKVQYVRGGVGRNVAECMSKLGLSPFFISVVGEDMAGDLLLAHWQSLGLKIDGIRRCPDASTPVVSAIFDEKGELAGAVADIYTFEKHLTPQWINQFQSHIRHASLIMLDANLNEAALQAACDLAKEAKVPIWFEPVSVAKSVRHSTIANHLLFASPNEAELVAMAVGAECKPEDAAKHLGSYSNVHSLIQLLQPHIIRLLEKRIKFVVLTLGGLGVVLCSKVCNLNVAANDDVWLPEFTHSRTTADVRLLDYQSSDVCYVHFPALPASVVSVSGAGDCFVAGALTALCMHRGLYASMAFGIAVARHAVESKLNVPSNLSEVNLTVDAEKVLSSAKLLRVR